MYFWLSGFHDVVRLIIFNMLNARKLLLLRSLIGNKWQFTDVISAWANEET
jgi:hypothetical protein